MQKIFSEEKIDNTKIVNDFCFNEDRLQEVEAFWSGENFFLKQVKGEGKKREKKVSL